MTGAGGKRLELASVLRCRVPETVWMTAWGEGSICDLIKMHHLLWRLGVLDKPNDLASLLYRYKIHALEIYRVGDVNTYRLHSTGNYWEFKLG